jgi:hypothetical protein
MIAEVRKFLRLPRSGKTGWQRGRLDFGFNQDLPQPRQYPAAVLSAADGNCAPPRTDAMCRSGEPMQHSSSAQLPVLSPASTDHRPLKKAFADAQHAAPHRFAAVGSIVEKESKIAFASALPSRPDQFWA